MTVLNTQYFAGLFDGEGCIYVQKVDRGGIIPSYQVRASINMTSRAVMELLQKAYGGFWLVHKKDLKNAKHKRSYELLWTSRRAYGILSEIAPHMIVKKREAELALQLQEHIDSNRKNFRTASPHEIAKIVAYRDWVFHSMKQLKKDPSADIGMMANSGELRCPALMSAEGQSRAKQQTVEVCGRV